MKKYLEAAVIFILLFTFASDIYSLFEDKGEKDEASYEESRESAEADYENYEKYTLYRLNAECAADTPYEALKAMAVVFRTYAYVTGDCTAEYTDEKNIPESVCKAVKATEGQAVMYNSSLILPVIHTASYGSTESAYDIYGDDFPYLVSVDSPENSECDGICAYAEYSSADFEKTLSECGYKTDSSLKLCSWITYMSHTDGGGVKDVYVFGNKISGTKFAEIFSLDSVKFSIDIVNGGFRITTFGKGDGVGLSKLGACLMAKSGFCYDEIITHYYKGTYIALYKPR